MHVLAAQARIAAAQAAGSSSFASNDSGDVDAPVAAFAPAEEAQLLRVMREYFEAVSSSLAAAYKHLRSIERSNQKMLLSKGARCPTDLLTT